MIRHKLISCFLKLQAILGSLRDLKMCVEHKDRIIFYFVLGILSLCGTLFLQSFVVYLVLDFSNITAVDAIQDVKVLSLSASMFINLFVGCVMLALFNKAIDLLRTIDSVVGSSRTASLHLLSSDDH